MYKRIHLQLIDCEIEMGQIPNAIEIMDQLIKYCTKLGSNDGDQDYLECVHKKCELMEDSC